MIDARTGQPLTTCSPEAAEQYRLAVDRILGSETGTAEALDHALALDGNFALALAARYMVARDANSADADLFKWRALAAAGAALPWERAHVSTLFALLEDPCANLAATEAYVAASPGNLLVISQLCGYLIFYGGVRKLERVLNIMEAECVYLRTFRNAFFASLWGIEDVCGSGDRRQAVNGRPAGEDRGANPQA